MTLRWLLVYGSLSSEPKGTILGSMTPLPIPWPFGLDPFDLQLARLRSFIAYVEWMRANDR